MTDIRSLLNRLMHRRDEKTREDDYLKQQVETIYRVYVSVVGPEKLILNASKYDALKYIHEEETGKRLIGLQRLILGSKDFYREPTSKEFPLIMDTLENKLSELLARKTVEEQLERKIAERLEEKHQEYVDEIKRELLTEEDSSCETPHSTRKLTKLSALDKVSLSKTAFSVVRPSRLIDVIGQESAVKAVASRIASPFPQHIILYGPPGVGKTTTARLVLEEAKKIAYTAFGEEAPFIECDGTTLRWDNRDMTNPLIGSVHDPLYQGAQKDLAEEGIPEPKPGLVTQAHGGVLFIDEIGELDPILLNKLLKVLEDKRVFFESAYYDEDNVRIPAYIKKLFSEGAPADFILIGATTRLPEEINPAIRSRCASVFFNPLQPEDVKHIVRDAAERLHVDLEEGVEDVVSEYTMEGRKAVQLLVDAYSMAVYEQGSTDDILVTNDIMKRIAQSGHMTIWKRRIASDTSKIGHVYGLGVSGYLGSTIEIETIAYPSEKGKGQIHFNDTAGTMAKDSVSNATAVVRALTGKRLSDYDLYVNIVGGGNIDGPSAGSAITCAIVSAIEEKPIYQNIALTGEISLSGEIKPVGGVQEKVLGAYQAGMSKILIPKLNESDVGRTYMDMQIIPVSTIQEVLAHVLADK